MILVLVATVASAVTTVVFIREAPWGDPAQADSQPNYLGDPASLNALSLPKRYHAVSHNTFECLQDPIIRCYVTSLPRHTVVRDVMTGLDSDSARTVTSPLMTAVTICGTLGATSGPVLAVVQPVLENARSRHPGSWTVPRHPQFGRHLAVLFTLTNHAGCDSGS